MTIKIRKYIIPFILLLFTIFLAIFSSTSLIAAKSGLTLWATSVVPSLFPFFVATELLLKTRIPYMLGKLFNKVMEPIFNIRGEGAFALIMGIISGYPIGTKITCKFSEDNVLNKEEGERLLSFTNNSGPLFIIGTIGINMYGSSMIGTLLFITHILACFSVGFLFRFWNRNFKNRKKDISNNTLNIINRDEVSISNLGECLSESISNSISTIMMIGGFVVIFSVITAILKSSHFINIVGKMLIPIFVLLRIPLNFQEPLIIGLFEITNGIYLISDIHIKALSINVILTAFLLGIGGISVFLQILSITAKSDLSIKPYIIGKILQGFIAAFYTFIFIKYIPIFNINLV